MRPDFIWIHSQLALGGRILEPHVGLIARHGINGVVDLTECSWIKATDYSRHGIRLLELPTEDLKAVSPESLWQGLKFVHTITANGGRALVHCHHGIGRSAMLVWCVLVSEGQEPRRALKTMKELRPQVSPSPDQIRGMIDWYREWAFSSGSPAGAADWQDLADIAYLDREPR